jgi:hypothetical protein
MRRLRGTCEEGFTLMELLVVVLLQFHKQAHRSGLRPN